MRSFGHVTQCAPHRGRSAGVDDAGPGRPGCIGIAESQWDFNDANAIPGFGPLRRTERVPALLEQTPGACDEAAETFPVMTVSFQQSAAGRTWLRAGQSRSERGTDVGHAADNADLFAGRQQRSGRCGRARSQSRRECPLRESDVGTAALCRGRRVYRGIVGKQEKPMRAFIAACLVAGIIGRHGAAVLDTFVQQPTSVAFTQPGVRV
jgi:hypothetical protein